MSHYDNAACSAVALKAMVLKVPAFGLSGLFIAGCLVVYPVMTDATPECPYGGTLQQFEVTDGAATHIEDKCVLVAPDAATMQKLRREYPDFVIRIATN